MKSGDPVALIMGGSGGIGRAIAGKLAQMRYRLALAARDADRLEAARLALAASAAGVECFRCDIGDESAVRRLVGEVEARFGRIDVLINAAGVGKRDFVMRTREETWQELMRTNALGVAFACKSVLALMKRQGGGHIINIGSSAGRHGVAGLAAYGASKAAMMAMTDSLREEARRSGIKVSTVVPDRVDTGMQGPARTETPPPMIQPADIAEAVAFLLRLSPAASVPEVALYAGSD